MERRKILGLLKRYLKGRANAVEKARVDKWYNARNEAGISSKHDPAMKELLYNRIRYMLDDEPPVLPFYQRSAFRVAIAVIIVAVIAAYYWLSDEHHDEKVITKIHNTYFHNDLSPPVDTRAVLTLSDGTRVEIDSSRNGMLAVQGKIKVVKNSNGQIEYSGTASAINSYNILSVPKGSKPVKLVLADGSLVWLNVASSVRYPTAFAGKERSVEITGEVYFEIAKNKQMPFVVKRLNDDTKLQVLGTRFNVNGYEDEASLKVTLLEGSLNVSKGHESNILKPGQQAELGKEGMQLLNNVNTDEVMAWKNGRFHFDGSDIRTIMRQVEKWYNVDVEYRADIPVLFVANIQRDVKVSELLNILALTELVHFEIKGNKIIVTK